MHRSRKPETGDQDWRTWSLCRGLDPAIMYPEEISGVIAAKKVCEQCPVQEPCLEHALVNREPHGVWGGKSERQRRSILARRRRQQSERTTAA